MNLRLHRQPLAVAIATLFAAPLLAAPATQLAPDTLPSGGQVVAGQAAISQTGARMDITQTSQRAILDWNRFDIGSQAHVNFAQPSATAVALNRVLAGEASQIHGRLTANGQVYLVNPNGVLFGAGSRVDVGGIVATSMDIANDDFMAGRDVFRRNGATGKVINQGRIDAAAGGLVALLAPDVRNEGVIAARMGNVVLAAGERVTLDAGADGHLKVAVDPATVSTLVENRHLVQADGGQVVMSAEAADTLLSAVVANSGTVQAQTLENRNGRIYLLASMSQGEVRQDGLLDASAPNGGDGGFVETSAGKVGVGGTAKVTTRSAHGRTGTWLIDPNDYTIAASGGDITGAQLSSQLNDNNIAIQSANGATNGNGDIFVNDAVSWSANQLTLSATRNIYLNRSLNGSGTARLALEYGQGAVAAGNTADYYVNAPVNLPAGQNFSTKLGSNGATDIYTVITSLGVAGDATTTTLQGIKNNLSGKYALGANIDASTTSGWEGGAGFLPLGAVPIGANWWDYPTFSGRMDGLGHTISGLTINRPTTNHVGLFGMVSGTIQNIGLAGGSVSGGFWVGGLVGTLDQGTVYRSYATSAVTGSATVGGLVGEGIYSSVSNSYAAGSVNGSDCVGGLIGYGTAILLSNSYATGSVSGSSNVGGLVGMVDNGTDFSSSYWNTDTSGQATSAGGTGKTTVQMKQQASFSGWDFTNTWRIYEGQSYPVLRALQHDLTVTANNATRTYDGQAYSGGNGVTYSISGAPTTGTISYGGTSQGATNAGTYAITLGGLTLNRTTQQDFQSWGDTLVYQSGTLTVSKAPLTVTANAASKTYDGLAYSGGNGVAYSGFVNGETSAVLSSTLAWGGSSQGATNAGSYVITPPGLTSGNYTITVNNGTLTVSKAPLTVTANAASKTYDGLAYSGGNGVAYSGFVNSETSAVLGGTLAYGGNSQGATNAGSYTITPSGLTSGNYTITFNNGTLTVSKAPLTVTANAASKTYDGLAYSGGNGVAYSGFVNSETSAVLGGTLAYGGNSQGVTNAGSYAITPSGLTSGNYTIMFNNGTLTIDPATLTLLAVGADNKSKLYGAVDPALTYQLSSGALASGDSFSGSLTRDAGENVGGYAIRQGSLTAGSNYTIDFTNGVLTINKAPLTVTANAASKTYDGLAWSGGNGVAYSGFVNSETSAVLGGTLAYGGTAQGATNAGSYAITPSGLTSGNYTITFANGGLTIMPAPLAVTANDANKTADGNAWSGGNGVIYSGFVNGETAAALAGVLAYAGSSQGAASAGSYTITPSGLTSGNYTITFVDGVLTITAVPPAPTLADNNQPDGGQLSLAVMSRQPAAAVNPQRAEAPPVAPLPGASTPGADISPTLLGGLLEVRGDFIRLAGE